MFLYSEQIKLVLFGGFCNGRKRGRISLTRYSSFMRSASPLAPAELCGNRLWMRNYAISLRSWHNRKKLLREGECAMKQKKAYYHLPDRSSSTSCTGSSCLCSGRTENTFMTGATSAPSTAHRQTASGAGDGLASGSMTPKKSLPDAGIRHLGAADLQQLAPPGGTSFG